MQLIIATNILNLFTFSCFPALLPTLSIAVLSKLPSIFSSSYTPAAPILLPISEPPAAYLFLFAHATSALLLLLKPPAALKSAPAYLPSYVFAALIPTLVYLSLSASAAQTPALVAAFLPMPQLQN